MKATRLWYCDFCDREILLEVNQNISILNRINTKKNMALLLQNTNLFKQEKDEVNFIHTDTIQDCRIDQMLSFEYRFFIC